MRRDELAAHRVSQRFGDGDRDKLTDQLMIVAAEINHAIVFGAPLQLAEVLFRDTCHKQLLLLADHAAADFNGILRDTILENLQPLFLDFLRGVIRQISGRSSGARAVNKAVGGIKTNVADQLHGRGKVLFGFIGEADNKI